MLSIRGPYGVNHIAAFLFFQLFHDDNTHLFGDFYKPIFSGMYMTLDLSHSRRHSQYLHVFVDGSF